MRYSVVIFLTIFIAGCYRHEEPKQAATVLDTTNPRSINPSDWGPSYLKGMEFGPASGHLSRAFGQAELFLSKQPFAKDYARRACSGGGDRFVDVNFALLSNSSGKPYGTVRVDTDTGECVWLGEKK